MKYILIKNNTIDSIIDNSFQKNNLKKAALISLLTGATMFGNVYNADAVTSNSAANTTAFNEKNNQNVPVNQADSQDDYDSFINDMEKMRHDMTRQFWNNGRRMHRVFGPHHNSMSPEWFSDEKNYTLELEVPGFEKDQLKVEIQGEYLIVSTKRFDEKKDNKATSQFRKSFRHSTSLPKDIDRNAITSNLKNGVLTLTLPRTPNKKEDIKEIVIN